MKSVLIIETPKNCGDCPCVCDEFAFCQADKKNRDCDWYKTPSWCPLKPMPLKKVVTVKRIEDIQSYSITEVADKISAKIILKTDEVFALGWNACLDSIIGENNESNISC